MRKFQGRDRRQFNKNKSRHYKGKRRKHDGPPPFDVLLKRWKKYVEVNGIIAEVKRREFYVKPSEVRQRKINASKRRVQKQKRLEAADWERRRRESRIW